jgi:hypothetical protein
MSVWKGPILGVSFLRRRKSSGREQEIFFDYGPNLYNHGLLSPLAEGSINSATQVDLGGSGYRTH